MISMPTHTCLILVIVRFAGQMYFTKDHEYLNVSGNKAKLGITDHAQVSFYSFIYHSVPPLSDMNRPSAKI